MTAQSLQVRDAISAMQAAGCKREGRRILEAMPRALAGVYQSNLGTDFESVFGKKLDYQAFNCSKLTTFLIAECPDFLEPPGETLDQYVVEVGAYLSHG
jgi:hypothetical protein